MNRDAVFLLIRNALDLVQHVATDAGGSGVSWGLGSVGTNGQISPTVNGDSGIGLASMHPNASKTFKEMEVGGTFLI
jgi:hypothetical protein